MERQYRPTFWTEWSATKVISLSDHLDIQKVVFTANNKNGSDRVMHYMDFQDALALCDVILNTKFVALYPATKATDMDSYTVLGRMESYGGGKPESYGGKVESRLFSIEAIQDKNPKEGASPYRWIIKIKIGEGEQTKYGTIVPKASSQMVTQTNFLTAQQMYKMASMMKLYIETWFNRNFTEIYKANGKYPDKSEVIHDEIWKDIQSGKGSSSNSYTASSSMDDIPT